MAEAIEWIELPVKFRGIWYSPTWGGFDITLRDRFRPRRPPDRLLETLKRSGRPIIERGPHQYANPTWVSRKEIEKKFGRVIAVVVNKSLWENKSFFDTANPESLLIFTTRYVICLEEYDGMEYFIALPRWPPSETRR